MSLLNVEVKYHAKLGEFGRRLGAPLVEIARMTLERVHARTSGGQGPNGPLKPIGYRVPYTGVHFWLKPGPSSPAPAGWLFKVERGPHAGWVCYRDYATYAALHGRSRDLTESGAAWASARIRLQSPTRATVAFYGTHRDGTGTAHPGAIMHAALKHEAQNLFALAAEDKAQIREVVRERIREDMIEAAALGGRTFKAERRAEALGRRVSRLAGRR